MSSLKFKNENGEWQRIAGYSSVAAFNGRAGVVRPQAGDYTAEMVGAAPAVHTHTSDQVGAVNHNLLHNWYFVNPVNQRGKTEYTSAGYTIDRWYSSASTQVVTISNAGLVVNSTESGTSHCQYVYNEALAGKEVTMSVLVGNGCAVRACILDGSVFAARSPWGSNGVVRITATLPDQLSGPLRVAIQLQESNTDALIIAAKLELGSTQTLAHNEGTEENPIWILNEIPDYNEELMKCRRSTADSSDIYANQPVVHGYVTNPNLLDNWYFVNPVN